jgi:hypothetical protein
MFYLTRSQILKLLRTFRDQNCVYMLLEFCQGKPSGLSTKSSSLSLCSLMFLHAVHFVSGGDMFTLLGREGGRFSSSTAMFYAAIGAQSRGPV